MGRKESTINYLHARKFLMILFVVCCFSNLPISKKSFRNTCSISVSNSLDPNQAQHFVGSGLGPIFFKDLSADDTRRQSSFHENDTEFYNIDQTHLLSGMSGPDLGLICLQKLSDNRKGIQVTASGVRVNCKSRKV